MARVFLREELELPPDLYEQQRQYRRNMQAAVEQMIQDGIEAGTFRDVDPKMVAFAMFGMTNWMQAWFDPEGRYTTDEVAAVFADLLLLGMMRRDGAPAPGSVEVTLSEMAGLVGRLSDQVAELRDTRRPLAARDGERPGRG
jgi:hypothetical protein